jgi:hypothetical protein
MNKPPKRLLSLALALVLAFTLAPANAPAVYATVGDTVPGVPPSDGEATEGITIPSLEDWIAATFPADGETDPVTDDTDNETDPGVDDDGDSQNESHIVPPVADDDTPTDGETDLGDNDLPDGDNDLPDDETDLGDNNPSDDDVPIENDMSVVGEAAAEQTQAAPPADLDDELLTSLQEASTIGLTSNLTPRYGPNGKFLAPIEAPVEGSVGISTRAELEAIKNNLSGKYHLTADIDLAGADWAPIGSNYELFSGSFDGQGHVIRNLTISGNAPYNGYAGLFGQVSGGATIKNVGLESTNINVNSYGSDSESGVGGICGIVYGSEGLRTTISNCYNTGYVSVSSESFYKAYAGGICGHVYDDYKITTLTIISNCYNTGSVTASSGATANSYAGGIYGRNATHTIDGNSTSIISNCYNTGDVSVSSGGYAGGIGGTNWYHYSPVTTSNCYNTGSVTASSGATANSYAGGIYGQSVNSTINNCYNTGSVAALGNIGNNVESGGICGTSNNSTINNCYNTGDVRASGGGYAYAGGIGGDSIAHTGTNAWLGNCYNTGNVTASGNYAGYAGGICGSNSTGVVTADNCYNTGSVTASGGSSVSYTYAGGICGNIGNYLTVRNCYNTGYVSANNNDDRSRSAAGGISGNAGTISNCYNTGDVNVSSGNGYTGSGNAGGISGGDATVTSCYWNIDSKQTVNGTDRINATKRCTGWTYGAQGSLTTAEMKSASSFTGFDFDTVWAISRSANGGFPYLRALPVPADPDSGLVNARIDESAHHITVASSKNKKIPRATVTIDGQSHTTDSNGRLRYTGNYGEKTVTVSAAGYRASEQRYNLKKGAARTIYLEAEAGDGKPYVTMASDLGTGDDLRYQTRCYQTGDSKTIRIQAKGNWGSHSAGNFVLYQDGGKKLTTASGLFEFAPGKVFAANKPIKLKMVPASGTESAPVTLKLEVGTTFTESGLDNLSSYKITDDKEGSVTDKDALKLFPGDYTLQISSLPIKIKKEVKADGTVVYKGTIGINSDNYLRDDGAWTSYKKDFEKASKNLANTKKLYDYMTMLGGASGYFNVEKKLMKPKINGVGYFEIRYDKNGREIQSSGGVIVAGSSNGALTRQFLLGPIPIYYCALKQ